MKYYSFDYNGVFEGEYNADLCQVTEEKKKAQKEGEEIIESVPLLPSHSTLKAPPSELEEGYQWKFMNGDWYASKIPEAMKEEILEPSYADKRAMEYPSFLDYVDGVVKNDKEQIKKYIAECLAVKAKYPKPEK